MIVKTKLRVLFFVIAVCMTVGNLCLSPAFMTNKNEQDPSCSSLAPLLRSSLNLGPIAEQIDRLRTRYNQTQDPEQLAKLFALLNPFIQDFLLKTSTEQAIGKIEIKNAIGSIYKDALCSATKYPRCCFEASDVTEQILAVLFPEFRLYHVCIETKQGANKLTHYVTVIGDPVSGHWFYLSFTDGQFVTWPDNIERFTEVTLLNDPKYRIIFASSQEYLNWYKEQGLGQAAFYPLDFVPVDNDLFTSKKELDEAIQKTTDMNGQYHRFSHIQQPRQLLIDEKIKLFSQFEHELAKYLVGQTGKPSDIRSAA